MQYAAERSLCRISAFLSGILTQMQNDGHAHKEKEAVNFRFHSPCQYAERIVSNAFRIHSLISVYPCVGSASYSFSVP